MSMNPLNDISQVYLEKVANVVEAKKSSKKEKHIKAAKAGKRWQDSDGDGKWYEPGEDVAVKEAKHATAKQMHSPHEVPSGNIKGLVKKAVKRIDIDVDGDTDNNDKAKGELGEFIPGVGNKRLYSTTKVRTAKESFSNWRQDLIEVIDSDDEEKKQVKEKNVKNTIKINPKISEEVTIVEMVELSEDHELETLNSAVDFFVEEGINEDGLEMVIEELGLEEFVDLVYEVGYETLSEARTLTGKKKNPKRLPKGTAPAKTTKATIAKGGRTIKAASPSGAFKRRPAAAKAVETAKKEQPKKKPVRDAIARGVFGAVKAYKAGMERHKKAMGAAKETGKTIAKAAAVTHEAGRRVGQTKAGQAVKKAGIAALKAGAEKAKKDIESLKAKNRVKKEEYEFSNWRDDFKALEIETVDLISAEELELEEGLFGKKKRPLGPPKARYGGSSEPTKDTRYQVSKADVKANTPAAQRLAAGDKRYKMIGEEGIDEVYKGKHGQSDKEYADSRSPGGKMVSGDSKQSGAEYTHGRRVKAANPGMQPDVGGKTKPKSQGKMDRGTRADLEYRKANLKKNVDEAAQSQEDKVRLQNEKKKQILLRLQQEILRKKKSGQLPGGTAMESAELDERTRYAKETGKDYTTGKPSVKGGEEPPAAMKHLQKKFRDTGGMMSSRKKPIQPQGQKKTPGKKGYQGVTPVDKIKGQLAKKRAPKPDPYGYGQGRYQGD